MCQERNISRLYVIKVNRVKSIYCGQGVVGSNNERVKQVLRQVLNRVVSLEGVYDVDFTVGNRQ